MVYSESMFIEGNRSSIKLNQIQNPYENGIHVLINILFEYTLYNKGGWMGWNFF